MNILVATPVGCLGPELPAASIRAGGFGLLNLTFLQSPEVAARAARDLASTTDTRSGLILHGRLGRVEDAALDALGAADTILLFPEPEQELRGMVDRCRETARTLGLVATCAADARLAERLGFDLVVAKGGESGGIAGEETTFVLLQHLLQVTTLPIVAWGGVGPNGLAACAAGGAAGVLLDWQLSLTRECRLPLGIRRRIAAMDGTESLVVNGPSGRHLRLLWRPGMTARDVLQRFSRELAERSEHFDSPDAWDAWRDQIAALISREDVDDRAWLVGQDGAFASGLARNGGTVGTVLAHMRERAEKNLAGAAAARVLGPEGPLARSHGTRYPIVQGPMTRVSDVAPFSLAVAEAGALPLVALALARDVRVRQLLVQHRELLGDRPWGAGVLGFVDHEVWQDQVRAIEEVRPPFALIAGGRPDQARVLEARGIRTYVHVASPEVLREYVREGTRRFVFEGRECGGHVGPRTSFVLWESAIEALEEASLSREQMSEIHVLFAGGVHDDRSAAMVAAMAQPLVERGAKIGVLIGTAYLFTQEIVSTGAVVPGFQQVALETDATVLLETGPGHSTRCAPTSFYRDFRAAKDALLREQASAAELRVALEQLNLGRLRIGAKGIERRAPGEAGLVSIDEQSQRARGMYMLGQVAALHQQTISLHELHERVSPQSCTRLEAIARSRPTLVPVADAPRPPALDVAIVGMACLMPGAKNVAEFWERILAAKDSIAEIPESRFDWRGRYDATGRKRDHIRSRWGGFLDDVPFDPLKYGIPPAAIPAIEPMQLLALELVDAALRDCGREHVNGLRQRTSVVLGIGGGLAELGTRYVVRALLPEFIADPEDVLSKRLPEWTEDSFAGILLNVVAGRVADRFDLGGMNLTVDAACASSLAAVYVACSELTSGASDMVIAGGGDTLQNAMGYQCFDSAGALSPRGRCRPFDASADGIAISEGLAAVVLKRRVDAERAGDRIYAVIRGVGTGSDGRSKGLTAPGPEGQRRTLERAYSQARIDPATVALIEAHGTGTARGDVVEAATLSSFLTDHGVRGRSCAIGSVKSNIGHTKCAAGVAGLIKAALSLYHGVFPPTLHVEKPNPEAISADGPLYVNSELRPWIRGRSPRRAGVSAFGFGGTNFHTVLEEYAHDAGVRDGLMPRRQLPAELFLLSAASWPELTQRLVEIRDLARAAEGQTDLDLASLAYRIHRRNRHAPLSKRVALVAESLEGLGAQIEWLLSQTELDSRLSSTAPAGVTLGDSTATDSPGVAFLFAGQGAQHPRMLNELAIQFSEVRLAFELLDRTLERNVSSYVFPPPAFDDEERSRQFKRLMATDIAQPALGACGVGLTRLLASFGVRPKSMGGHSYGELTALWAAGCLDEASLYRLSLERAQAMLSCEVAQAESERGAMLAVLASETVARAELAACDGVFLANVNGPRQIVIGGQAAAIRLARKHLEARGISATPLPVNYAFHTPYMRQAGETFTAACARTLFHPPARRAFCNVTAAAHDSDASTIRDRLVEHLTSPVRFVEMVEAIYESGARVFVEAGPSDILSRLVREILGSRPHEAIPLQTHDHSGVRGLLRALARLFVSGVNVDAERLYEGRMEPASEGGAAIQHRAEMAWLVNGARARKKDSPPADRPQPLVAVSAKALDARPARLRVPQAASDPGAAEVVLQFQRNMRELLREQTSIMKQYLGASAASPASVPASSREYARADRDRPPIRRPLASSSSTLSPAPGGNGAHAAVPARQPVQPAAAGGGQRSEAEDLFDALVRLTSEKTGYPPSALSLDARLEADLGIDSIKRLEIVAALRRQVTPEVTEPPAWFARQMVSATSLRDIVAGIQELKSETGLKGQATPATATAPSRTHTDVYDDDRSLDSNDAAGVCWRWMPTAVETPPAAMADLPGGSLVVTDDHSGLAERFVQFCAAKGRRAVLLDDAALESRASAAAALRDIRGRGAVAGIVHLAPLSAAPAFPDIEDDEWQRRMDSEVKSLLFLMQALSPELASGAEGGPPALLFAASLGGGQFVPHQRNEVTHPWRGGIAGLLKTAALEWPEARCRAADFDEPPDAATLWRELTSSGPVEIGYRGRRRLSLRAVAAPPRSSPNVSGLDASSVFLVTGGARGITAEVVKELSARTRATMILLGRTAMSAEPESAETMAIEDPIELRRVMARLLARAGAPPAPLEIDRAAKQLLAGREIRRTLAALERSGSTARYIQCDVRSYESLENALRNVRREFGEITAVLHGAGVIEDRRLLDKTAESFDLVVGTKLEPMRHLLKLLDPARLRHVLLFSSTSAFSGNPGQADYAAANEILNRLGRCLSDSWPGKITAIGWGPWSGGGMVTPDVAREFAKRGIPLVSPSEGRIAAWRELASPEREARVLIGRGPWSEGDITPDGRTEEPKDMPLTVATTS